MYKWSSLTAMALSSAAAKIGRNSAAMATDKLDSRGNPKANRVGKFIHNRKADLYHKGLKDGMTRDSEKTSKTEALLDSLSIIGGHHAKKVYEDGRSVGKGYRGVDQDTIKGDLAKMHSAYDKANASKQLPVLPHRMAAIEKAFRDKTVEKSKKQQFSKRNKAARKADELFTKGLRGASKVGKIPAITEQISSNIIMSHKGTKKYLTDLKNNEIAKRRDPKFKSRAVDKAKLVAAGAMLGPQVAMADRTLKGAKAEAEKGGQNTYEAWRDAAVATVPYKYRAAGTEARGKYEKMWNNRKAKKEGHKKVAFLEKLGIDPGTLALVAGAAYTGKNAGTALAHKLDTRGREKRKTDKGWEHSKPARTVGKGVHGVKTYLFRKGLEHGSDPEVAKQNLAAVSLEGYGGIVGGDKFSEMYTKGWNMGRKVKHLPLEMKEHKLKSIRNTLRSMDDFRDIPHAAMAVDGIKKVVDKKVLHRRAEKHAKDAFKDKHAKGIKATLRKAKKAGTKAVDAPVRAGAKLWGTALDPDRAAVHVVKNVRALEPARRSVNKFVATQGAKRLNPNYKASTKDKALSLAGQVLVNPEIGEYERGAANFRKHFKKDPSKVFRKHTRLAEELVGKSKTDVVSKALSLKNK